MINALRKAVYKHGYLIIAAAWLYTISFIFSNYWSYYSSPGKVKNNLEQRLHGQENEAALLSKDTALLWQLVNPYRTLTTPITEDFGVFIYEQKDTTVPIHLLYWNTNRIYVNVIDLTRKPGSYFVTNQNGDFELIKRTIGIRGVTFSFIAMLPIRWSYFLENKYLQTYFEGYRNLVIQYDISNRSSALPILNGDGKRLFGIELKEGKSFIAYDSVTIIFRVLAILLLLIFVNSLAQELIVNREFNSGFFFLLSVALTLRIIAYRFHFPFDFSKIPLFDPTVYASNFLHPSLGDLFINAVLLYWLVSFYHKHADKKANEIKSYFSKIYSYAGLILLTVICFLLVGIIISLVKDSKISFDVTNLNSLGIYSLISFIILCLGVLSFYHFSQILLSLVFRQKISTYWQLLSIVLFGFIYMGFFTNSTDYRLYLWVIAWLLLYVGLLNFRKEDIEKPLLQSSFFIFWVMIFAMSISSIVIYENRIVEFEQRKGIAEKLALQTDPSGESLLNIAATNFDDQFLSQNFNRLSSNEYANKYIKDSLINQNFSGYLNKYDTHIFIFDSLYHPLFNEDSTNYASIKTILLNKAKPTIIPDLFTYENTLDGLSYVYQKVIKRNETLLGYLFVTITSKRYKSEALYPELFNQVSDIASDLNTNYAYAVYNRGKLINHFNTYDFPSQLDTSQIPIYEFSYKQAGEFNELWYKSSNQKQVLVVKRNTWFLEFITLFAYLFCSFLSIILLFHLGSFVITARFKWDVLRKMIRLNIRSQIQATIIFLSVFSFVVIGIATISFFILRFHRNNQERLSKSIQVMANEVNNKRTSLQAFDDVPDNIGVRNELEKTIAEISDLHNVDINYFNLEGNLVISTQPYIFNKHLLSTKMEPHAYQELKMGHSIRYLQSEKIGSFEFLSIYVPLTDDLGNDYAYLNIPYLNSQNELNQEISGFLATLINLNAFIFLIAGTIAFFLTNRITASFSLIGKKMQEMSLGKINEEIYWKRDDEIGVLVLEYNKMVKKLEKSALALAQSEREGAWREMAKQVAHEIKNPLTPMKLSIQYLQKAIEKGAPNVKVISENMAVTLIEQIDQLSKIASDFSQFANMGNTKMEIFDLTEVLVSIIRLYGSNPRLKITYQKDEGVYTIFADKVQMNRLFTNLFQNAIEASTDETADIRLEIHQKIDNQQLIVSIKDFSGGISKNRINDIFKPNFTTKTSGTGLGLAICKGIVEQSNGMIWFESEEGVGTTFFIQLPMGEK